MKQPVERRLAAILATDVADYLNPHSPDGTAFWGATALIIV